MKKYKFKEKFKLSNKLSEIVKIRQINNKLEQEILKFKKIVAQDVVDKNNITKNYIHDVKVLNNLVQNTVNENIELKGILTQRLRKRGIQSQESKNEWLKLNDDYSLKYNEKDIDVEFFKHSRLHCSFNVDLKLSIFQRIKNDKKMIERLKESNNNYKLLVNELNRE